MRDSQEDKKTGRSWGFTNHSSRLAVFLFTLSCAGAGGDVVPQTHDVRVSDASAGAGDDGAYEYVVKGTFTVVGLAEARGVDPEVAHEAVRRVALALDTCVTRGGLTRGAARVIARIDADGRVADASARVDSGAASATAVECLVVPLRSLSFPPSDAGARGLAIEALWGLQPPPTQ